MPSVKLLGHFVGKDVVRVDDEIIDSLKRAPVTSHPMELRIFLGIASYCYRFIKHFSRISAALHISTSGNKEFEWIEDTTSAFVTLNENLISPPMLCFPYFDPPFIVENGASHVANGQFWPKRTRMAIIFPCDTG